MYSMRHDDPELPAIMQRATCPELAERAMKVVQPVLSDAEGSRFRHDDGVAQPLDLNSFAAAIAAATGMTVNEIIVLPDDGKLPTVQKMAQSGQLAPRHRLSDLLHRLYSAPLRSLAPDIKDGLRRRLGRVFRLDDEQAAMSKGLDFAVRLARRDALYNFLALVVAGDEVRAKKLSGLAAWSRLAVPLAIVDPQRGYWLTHRVG